MRTEGEDEKHSTRFITKRCFASVFNGPPAPACLEKSRKVSAKVVTPRLSLPLSLSVFTLFSPLVSCLPFAPAATRQHGSRIIFHFLSSFLGLLVLRAASRRGKVPRTRRQFLPFTLFDGRQFALSGVFLRPPSLVAVSRYRRQSCQSKSGIYHILHAFFFLQNKSNIIVEATARSKAPCSSN